MVLASPAPGGSETGPNPTDRGKLSSKRHLITDRNSTPLALCVTGANWHDSIVFERLVDALSAIRGKRGRPLRWTTKLHADRAYDRRAHLRLRGTMARIARKGIESKERLGRHRWEVERTHAWLARARFERHMDIQTALYTLGPVDVSHAG